MPKSVGTPRIEAMDTVYDVLKVVHIAAWALVVIGYLKNFVGRTSKDLQINEWMTHGLEAAFILGLVLVGIASASDDVADPNNAKIAVKTVVAFAALGVAHAMRKRPAPNPFAHVVAGLVLVNVVLAYAW